MTQKIKEIINDSIETHKLVNQFMEDIEEAANVMISALKKGNKILVCGNGGSASQAQHFTGELIGKFLQDRRSLAGICLNTDTTNLTAIGNDYGIEKIFKRQVEGLGKQGDVLVCFSTSGNSENLVQAVTGIKDIQVINLLGMDGGKMKDIGDINIIIPSKSVPRIQECHLLILHIWAKLIEDSFL